MQNRRFHWYPTNIGFADDQLFPGSIGISPPYLGHSSFLRQAQIQPFKYVTTAFSACQGIDHLVSGQILVVKRDGHDWNNGLIGMIHAYISTIETKLPVLTGWSLIPKVRGANRIDSWPLLLVSCLASRFRMQQLDDVSSNDTSNLNFPSRYSFTIVLNRFQAFNEAGFPTIPNKVGTFERQFGFSGDTYE